MTLGSQRAKAISVLPSMNGIIAEFGRIEAPPNWSDPAEKPHSELRLTVWTSEGSASVDGKVILYDSIKE